MNNQLPSETLFKRILFCTDFSENANFAFDFAVDSVRRRPGSILYLLHVVPESEAEFWKSYIYEVENVDTKAKHDIDIKIDQTYRSRVPEGVEFRVEFRVGKDSLEILKFAEENNIDLIIIGRQGRSGLSKTFFGNVTEKISRKAPCAVLIIPATFEKKVEKEDQ